MGLPCFSRRSAPSSATPWDCAPCPGSAPSVATCAAVAAPTPTSRDGHGGPLFRNLSSLSAAPATS
eukprot:8951123-Lingulodinium_polyedra.AAC.1